MNNQIQINEDQLDTLIETTCIEDCPIECGLASEKDVPWCSEEFCISQENHECLKKWLCKETEKKNG